ncbi:YfiR family protein [Flammeovirgaceae bacterium SG7u.111]|nr:YfiR family protein [Flammeovirgaceae bacterium SG7u.132]WPO36821.1 YfiR family protein [Flammeovirgaceae bacterium SG7u.111]
MILKSNNTQKTILICLFMIIGFSSSAQTTRITDGDYEARKLFIHNFMKYIRWPNEEFGQDFLIAVVDNKKMYDILYKQHNNTNYRGRKVIVKNYRSVNELPKCSILYLPKEHSDSFDLVMKKIRNHSTLLVSDSKGLGLKGSGINFNQNKKVLKFELNAASLESANLKVSNLLKGVAILL